MARIGMETCQVLVFCFLVVVIHMYMYFGVILEQVSLVALQKSTMQSFDYAKPHGLSQLHLYIKQVKRQSENEHATH